MSEKLTKAMRATLPHCLDWSAPFEIMYRRHDATGEIVEPAGLAEHAGPPAQSWVGPVLDGKRHVPDHRCWPRRSGENTMSIPRVILYFILAMAIIYAFGWAATPGNLR